MIILNDGTEDYIFIFLAVYFNSAVAFHDFWGAEAMVPRVPHSASLILIPRFVMRYTTHTDSPVRG